MIVWLVSWLLTNKNPLEERRELELLGLIMMMCGDRGERANRVPSFL